MDGNYVWLLKKDNKIAMIIWKIIKQFLILIPISLKWLHKVYWTWEYGRWINKQSAILIYDDRYRLYDFIQNILFEEGPMNYVELGVGAGRNMRYWLDINKNPDSVFRGFDTFTGLPEDWGRFKAGHFSTAGEPPDIRDPRAQFFKGDFRETLMAEHFIHIKGRTLVNFDADLYSSTAYALSLIAHWAELFPLLMIFDEMSCADHEFRAFTEFVEIHGFRYEALAATRNYDQVLLEVKA